MKDTSLIEDGRSCTRRGGRPEAAEARKVEGVAGEPRECWMSENNTTDAKRTDLLGRTLKSTASYLENVLKLIVNPEKACICRIEGIRFLEYGFFSDSKNK